MSKNQILKFAIACALAGVAGVASAQNAPPPASSEVETVVVTGSFIRGSAENTALPVDVITSEELAKQGAPTVVELIKTLPGVGAVLGDSNQFNGATAGFQGVSNINLRGIGAQRTLVLMNGRRTNTDLNMIPMVAVGQLEVLKEGAAATYGSDAIAGVVNFITRKNFEGLELGGGYTAVPGSDGGDYDGSALWGYKGSGGNILIGAAYEHRAELKSTARDWAIRPYTENPTGWSGASNPGVYNWVNTTGVPAGTDPLTLPQPRIPATTPPFSVRDANCGALGGYEGFAGAIPRCLFYYVPFDNLVEKTNRFQIYGEANSTIGDSVNLHVEANYGKVSLPDYRVSPGYNVSNGPNGPGGLYIIPFTNPGYATFLAQTGATPPAGANALSAAVGSPWRPIAQGGNPIMGGTGGQRREVFNDSFRVSGELSGDITDSLHWNTALTYYAYSGQANGPDMLITRLQAALNGLGGPNCTGTTPGANGCQYFNPFSNSIARNPATGAVNPGYVPGLANDYNLVKWIFSTQRFETNSDSVVFDALLTGELPWSLPGGKIGWAGGVQARQGQSHTFIGNDLMDQRANPCPVPGTVNCATKTGPFTFLGQAVPSYLHDQVYAGFAELSLPILDTLNAQASVRYEDYGGLTGSTTNPKLSLKWQVADFIAIRASAGTTFRGPTAGNRTLSGGTSFTAIAVANNQSTAIDTFGNPTVGPETATTMNLGTILTFGGFRGSVDLWSIHLRDQITTAGTGPSIAAAVAPGGIVNCASPLAYLITFTQPCVNGMPGTTINRIRIDTTNGAPLKVEGIDFAADYNFKDLFGARAAVGANATYMYKYEQDAFALQGIIPVTPHFDAVGYLNFGRGAAISRWRGNLYAEYSPGIHNIRLDVNYIGGVRDDRAPITVQTAAMTTACTVTAARGGTAGCKEITFGQEIRDFIRLNLTYRIELPADLTVTAAVDNLLDRDPSEVRMEYSYDPNIGDPLGRTYRVNLRKKF